MFYLIILFIYKGENRTVYSSKNYRTIGKVWHHDICTPLLSGIHRSMQLTSARFPP